MKELHVIIDSSVLRNYKQGREYARRFVHGIIDGDISAGVSALSVTTLWADPVFDRKTEIGFTTILEFVKVVEVDDEVAKVMSSNLSMGNITLFTLEASSFASIAQLRRCPIVCENVNDYESLDVEVYDCQGYLRKLQTNH